MARPSLFSYLNLRKVGTDDDRKEFLTILSHELRNPLATVMTSLELLRLEEAHTPDAIALLKRIEKNVYAMTVMLDSLLNVPVTLPNAALAPTLEALVLPLAGPVRHKVTLRRTRRTYSILVVDDNELVAVALARLLELRGHTVAVAHNGAEALRKARELHPQIILLDIGLPDIDGYEVARELKEEKGFSATLIALTGYGHAEDKERASKAGFFKHLTNPVTLKEIEIVFSKLPRTPRPPSV